MRRAFWLVVGVGAGAVVGMKVVRSTQRAKERYAPAAVARRAGGHARSFGGRLRDAIGEGRAEMALREVELRAELDLPPS